MKHQHADLIAAPESVASLCHHLRTLSDDQAHQIDADRLSRAADLLSAPVTLAQAANLLLNDLSLALGHIEGDARRAAGKRWAAVNDAAENAPTMIGRATPIQMIRAGLQSLATTTERKPNAD